jgi:hypothetical protein
LFFAVAGVHSLQTGRSNNRYNKFGDLLLLGDKKSLTVVNLSDLDDIKFVRPRRHRDDVLGFVGGHFIVSGENLIASSVGSFFVYNKNLALKCQHNFNPMGLGQVILPLSFDRFSVCRIGDEDRVEIRRSSDLKLMSQHNDLRQEGSNLIAVTVFQVQLNLVLF